jgi:PAT family beta-lactamase induction signal transducer AmpG
MNVFLRAFTSSRVVVLLPLGIAAALPNALSQSTLTTWMATLDVDLTTIGYFALAGLPYNFKWAWAPLLDRYPMPFLGRRRGWMLAGQDPAARPGLVAALAVAMGFVGASFDVVFDAYRTDVLPPEERGSGTAMYVTGYRIALLLTGSVALVMTKWLTWRAIYLGLGSLLLLGVGMTLVAPEPRTVIRRPRSLAEAVVGPLGELFRRPRSFVVVGFVMLFTFGDAALLHMLSTFLYRKTGFTLAEIGTINKVAQFAGTVLGAMLGGALIVKWGVRRCLWIFGAAAAASNLLYVLLIYVGKSYVLLALAVAGDNFFGGLRTAAFVAFLMALCDPRYSATQYALLASAMSILGRLFSSQSAVIITAVGWGGFFGISAATAVPALALLAFVPRQAGEAPAAPEVTDRR